MELEWKLFADLAECAGDRRITVTLESGATIEDAFESLLDDRTALRDRVLDDSGELRSQVNLLCNGANVEHLDDGFETPLEEDDELALFPPVSGG